MQRMMGYCAFNHGMEWKQILLVSSLPNKLHLPTCHLLQYTIKKFSRPVSYTWVACMPLYDLCPLYLYRNKYPLQQGWLDYVQAFIFVRVLWFCAILFGNANCFAGPESARFYSSNGIYAKKAALWIGIPVHSRVFNALSSLLKEAD